MTSLAASRLGLPLALFGAALLFRALAFVPAVIDTDEGLYILQAREWLSGTWPLIGVWDMHPIGAPALIALAMLLPLDPVIAVRLLGAASVAATATALAALGRTLGLPAPVAAGAGLLSVALSVLFGGLATNTEILFAPFIVTALALAAREGVATLDRGEPPRAGPLVAVGLVAGIALTIKPVAFFEGCFAFAVAVGPAVLLREIAPARLLLLAGLYAAAAGAPTALIALAYLAQGALSVFVDVWFAAPFRYVGAAIALRDAAWMVVAALLFLAWPLVLAIAAVPLRRRVGSGRAVAFGIAWFAVATLAVAAPGMFFNHHFLVWLPPVALLAAAGAWAVAGLLAPHDRALVAGAMIALVAADAWVTDAAKRIETGPGFRRADPVRAVARSLSGTVPPGSTVWIVNYHPVVYVLADMAVPTRFAFPQHLAGWYSGVTGIDADAEIDRVLASRPAAIVVDRGWWSAIRPPIRGVVEAALARDYAFAARVLEANGPVEIYRLRGAP